MEALAIESLLWRDATASSEVLASLAQTFPGRIGAAATWSWRRVAQHGRAPGEMREAALTAGDTGIAPRTATATAEVQMDSEASRRLFVVLHPMRVGAGSRTLSREKTISYPKNRTCSRPSLHRGKIK
jgi:hypothetical protein